MPSPILSSCISWFRKSDTLLASLVSFFAFFLYTITLAPSVISISDDTLEFQLVALRGAIPHPTGYPLYAILLTLVARLLPFGDVAFRANLLSALLGAAAIGITYLVARAMRLERVAACVAAVLFALSPTFWLQATIAEVYPLHILLVAFLVLSLFSWGSPPTPSPSSPALTVARRGGVFERQTYLFWAALFLGLGLAHHSTTVLWGLSILFYLWSRQTGRLWYGKESRQTGRLGDGKESKQTGRLGYGTWGKLIGVTLLPLLFYLWLPLRSHIGSIDGTYQEVGFSCWIRACHYTGFFADNDLGTLRSPDFFMQLTLTEIGWVPLLFAIGGIIYLAFRARREWLFLCIALGINASFAVFYRVHDTEVFWLPVTWILTLFVGGGISGLLEAARTRFNAVSNPIPIPLQFALLALLLWPLTTRFPLMDRSHLTGAPTLNGEAIYGREMLQQPLPKNATIIGLLGEITYLRYLQESEDLNPTIHTAGGDSEPLRWQALEASLNANQPTFLTRPLTGIAEQWSLNAQGPLLEILPTPRQQIPDTFTLLNQPITNHITLAAWHRAPVPDTSLERITLAWHVHASPQTTLHISARLVTPDGSLACDNCQHDSPPLNNAYPTTLWRANEIVLDSYLLPPPPAGSHYLFIMYHPEDGSEVGRAEWGG